MFRGVDRLRAGRLHGPMRELTHSMTTDLGRPVSDISEWA